jgi:membrane protein DedA with SNARE-associated domain
MARRGGWAVFLGRWVGVLRALMPALAGMSRMPYRRFVVFNAAGGTLWATTVVLAGYLAGASWQRAQTYFGWVGGALLSALAAIAGATVVWRRVAARRATEPVDHPTPDDSAGHGSSSNRSRANRSRFIGPRRPSDRVL